MDGEAPLGEGLALHLSLVGFRPSLCRELGLLVCYVAGLSMSGRTKLVISADDQKNAREVA